MAGQNLGAKRPERTAITPRAAAIVGLRVAVPLGLLFLLAPRLLLGLFGLDDPIVLRLGQQFLAVLSVSALFLTVALSLHRRPAGDRRHQEPDVDHRSSRS